MLVHLVHLAPLVHLDATDGTVTPGRLACQAHLELSHEGQEVVWVAKLTTLLVHPGHQDWLGHQDPEAFPVMMAVLDQQVHQGVMDRMAPQAFRDHLALQVLQVKAYTDQREARVLMVFLVS